MIALWSHHPADAAVLMLDFGPTTATGASLTASPYHATHPAFTDTTWNKLSVSDVASGLLYSDGSAATGLSLRTGVETTATSNIINYTANPNGTTGTGTAFSSGIYADTSPARDFIFHSTNDVAIGVQIAGLAPGQYDIYFSARNTNLNTAFPVHFYAAAAAAGDTFDFTALTPVAISNGSSTNAWVETNTYDVVTVTLSAGQVLNIATAGAGTGANARGFLNTLQLELIPEPGTLALIGLAGVCLLSRRNGAGHCN